MWNSFGKKTESPFSLVTEPFFEIVNHFTDFMLFSFLCKDMNYSKSLSNILGNDFWCWSPSQHQSNGIWSLLSPDNFFPFNIPLAPLVPKEDSGTTTLHGEGGVNLRQKGCDVCRGTILGCDFDEVSASSDIDVSEEEFDASAKGTALLVPLPPPYAEQLKKRRLAYENWHKTIQVIIP